MVAEAKERGMKKCMVPWKNAGEAALVSDMQVFAVKNLADAVNILNGNGEYFDTPYNIEEMQTGRILDFADVSGQVLVKRACEHIKQKWTRPQTKIDEHVKHCIIWSSGSRKNNDRRADPWNFTFVKYKRTHGTF